MRKIGGGLYRIFAVGAVLALTGCGGGSGGGSGGEPGETGEGTASAMFAMSLGPDFYGNSVYLCGERQEDADRKYVCKNELPCGCYEFNSEGKLVQYNAQTHQYEEVTFKNLCPSNDVPSAPWEFTFTIFSDKTCGYSGGEALNGSEDRNFVCYDLDHLYDAGYENMSLEELHPGPNENNIICVTTNAQKTFDFDVCVDRTAEYASQNYYHNKVVLDCGCYPDPASYGKTCACSQGIDPTDLPYGCQISPYDDCNLVCDNQSYPVP